MLDKETSVKATISDVNIISDKDFKERVSQVFKCVADAVSKTLGPFGYTTIIEQFGEMHVTKDGWTVLKNINFDANIDNNILYLLTKIASQVVVKVGDGSTSSIVAADNILKQFNSSKIVDMEFGPREFTETLNKLVKIIVDGIQRKSIKVNDDDFNEARDRKIYNLAMISTNGNQEISEMISRVYAETENPSIAFLKGNYANHELEIVNGYKSQIRLLDGIYITNESGERYDIDPMVLMFDHRVDPEHYSDIIVPARAFANQNNRILYVIAPHYSEMALQRIKNDTNLFFKASQGKFQDVYMKASIVSNLSRQMYSDLACLLGATIIDTSMLEELMVKRQPVYAQSEDVNTEANADEVPREYKIIQNLGGCERITSNLKDTLFSGFNNKDEALYQVTMNDAVSRYQEAKDRFARMDVVSPEVIDLKQRISKLKCRMGIIKVGGISTLEQTANMDLVDDAVKACENAFLNGYNVGCSLIIPLVVADLLKQEGRFTVKEEQILMMIKAAFEAVYGKVIANKYAQVGINQDEFESKAMDIISGSLSSGLAYDLVKNEYSQDIINPSHTDIEILKAASSIASLLITSNQYLTIKLPNNR